MTVSVPCIMSVPVDEIVSPEIADRLWPARSRVPFIVTGLRVDIFEEAVTEHPDASVNELPLFVVFAIVMAFANVPVQVNVVACPEPPLKTNVALGTVNVALGLKVKLPVTVMLEASETNVEPALRIRPVEVYVEFVTPFAITLPPLFTVTPELESDVPVNVMVPLMTI